MHSKYHLLHSSLFFSWLNDQRALSRIRCKKQCKDNRKGVLMCSFKKYFSSCKYYHKLLFICIWSTVLQQTVLNSPHQGRYLGAPTWNWMHMNPLNFVFHGLPLHITDWDCKHVFNQQTSKSFLVIHISIITMRSNHCDCTHISSFSSLFLTLPAFMYSVRYELKCKGMRSK